MGSRHLFAGALPCVLLGLGLGCGGGAPVPPTPEAPVVEEGAQPAPAEAAADAPPDDAPAREAKAKASSVVGVRGTLAGIGEAATFTLCDGSTPSWKGLGVFADEVRVALGGSTEDVYVEGRAHKQEDGSLQPRAFDVAAVEGPGCAFTAEGWQLRAAGNEPFWSAELRGKRLVITRMDAPEPLEVETELTVQEPKRRAWSGTAEGLGAVTLDVRRERAQDTMVNAVYPYKATLTLGEATLQGWARTPPPE